MANKQQVPGAPTKAHGLKKYIHPVRNIAILLLFFWLGLNVGTGNISLTNSVSSNKELPANLSYTEVERMYDLLRAKYDGKLSEEALIDGLKSGLVEASGDPYSEYLDPKAAKEFNEQLSGSFSGIGAQLGKDDDGNVTVIAPIAGYPAEKAGLRAKDVIVTINGATTQGMSVDKAVSLIRGKAGTTVELAVVRGEREQKEFTITRENIQIPSVEYEILPGNIGYIQITQFWEDTPGLVQEAAREFKQANVKGVILDMRDNPGGSLPAAVDVASVWLPEGKTVLKEKRDGKVVQTYVSTGQDALVGVPTVVLVNEGSASASEIVAGALKDNKVATLLGIKTYGKGSVQQVIGLQNGGELKVTVARWFRPNGENIDKKGIKPDTEIKMTEADYEADKDPQKDAAIKQLLGQ